MISRKKPWPAYLVMPELNASTLGHSFKSWRQVEWVIKHGYTPKTPTRVGTAAHSIIEFLPRDRFDEFFCVEPNFANSPDNQDAKGNPSTSPITGWVREQKQWFRETEERTVLSWQEYSRLGRILDAISMCPEALELIARDSDKELTVTAEINGVECKARIDGLSHCGVQWNLKTTASLERFRWQVRDLHYLWKDAFHMLLLEENGIKPTEFVYIAVEDARPAQDGSYNCAPECALMHVPVVALENFYRDVKDRIAIFKHCLETGNWPGIQSDELEIYDMPETTLVD